MRVKLISLGLAASCLIGLLPTAQASAEVHTGKCGKNTTWTIEASCLTISGEGSIKNYDDEDQPWKKYQKEIEKVIIEDGVTAIGAYAFEGFPNAQFTIADSVSYIGECAFAKAELQNIDLPADLIEIGDDAFYQAALTEIHIPDRVELLGTGVFYGNEQLSAVSLPSELYEIPDRAFFGCSKLTQIALPDALEFIGNEAFYNSGLAQITIPENVTYIGERAFGGTEIETIHLPASVETISQALNEANKLKSITVAADNPYLCADQQGILYNKDQTTLMRYPAGSTEESCTIPDSVTSIEKQAFYYAASLREVYFGAHVAEIGMRAFYGCSALQSVDTGKELIKIGAYAFSDTPEIKIVLGTKLQEIGREAFSGCQNVRVLYRGTKEQWNKITMDYNPFPYLGTEYAFEYGVPHPVTGIRLTDTTGTPVTSLEGEVGSVTTIIAELSPQNADNQTVIWTSSDETVASVFDGRIFAQKPGTCVIRAKTEDGGFTAECSFLVKEPIIEATDIVLSENELMLTVGETAELTATLLPENAAEEELTWKSFDEQVATVENGVITAVGAGETSIMVSIEAKDIRAVCQVIVAEQYQNLSWWISMRSDGIQQLNIAGTGDMAQTSQGEYPWYSQKDSFSAVNICEGVTSVGRYAFDGYSGLTSITLPDSLTTIGTKAFWQSGIKSIFIPANVHTIGDSALCTKGLKEITVAENQNLFSADQGILYNKNKTTLICCPAMLGESIVEIPEGVETIESYAFYGYKAPFDVVSPTTLKTIKRGAFQVCELCDISIPAGFKTLGRNAFSSSGVTLYYSGTTEEWGKVSKPTNLLNRVVCGTEFVPAEYVSVRENSMQMTVGDTAVPEVCFFPENTTNQSIRWISQDPAIASVDVSTGEIKALSGGAATITGTPACTVLPELVISVIVSEDIVAEGACGDQIHWMVTRNGSLKLSGSGWMPNYDSESSPWSSYGNLIQEIVIDPHIISIGSKAFAGMTNVEQVYIPERISNFYSDAFDGCSNLREFTVSPQNQSFMAVDGILFTKDGKELVLYPERKDQTSYTIPAEVEKLWDNAFANNQYLTSVSVGDGALRIVGYRAFFQCSQLVQLDLGRKLEGIGELAFGYCGVSELLLPKTLNLIEANAFCRTNSERVKINYTGSKAEWNSIWISDEGNDNLDIKYNYGTYVPVKQIQIVPEWQRDEIVGIDDCFTLTAKLTPEDATNTEITWSSSNEAVAGVDQNGEVTCYSEGYAVITARVEEDDIEATYSLDVKNKCGSYSWFETDGKTLYLRGRGKMDYFKYPGPWNGSGFERVVVDDGITGIGENTFNGLSELRYVSLPESVSVVDDGAFSECTSLKMIDLSHVECIDPTAFYGCTSLAEITLGSSLRNVLENAFGNTPSLKTINYTGTEKEWTDVLILEDGNDALLGKNCTIHYESFRPVIHTESTAEQTKNGLMIYVECTGETENYIRAVAGYNQGKLVDFVTIKDGYDSAYLNGDQFDEVRTMVWDSLSGMTPLSRVEVLTAEQLYK